MSYFDTISDQKDLEIKLFQKQVINTLIHQIEATTDFRCFPNQTHIFNPNSQKCKILGSSSLHKQKILPKTVSMTLAEEDLENNYNNYHVGSNAQNLENFRDFVGAKEFGRYSYNHEYFVDSDNEYEKINDEFEAYRKIPNLMKMMNQQNHKIKNKDKDNDFAKHRDSINLVKMSARIVHPLKKSCVCEKSIETIEPKTPKTTSKNDDENKIREFHNPFGPKNLVLGQTSAQKPIVDIDQNQKSDQQLEKYQQAKRNRIEKRKNEKAIAELNPFILQTMMSKNQRQTDLAQKNFRRSCQFSESDFENVQK